MEYRTTHGKVLTRIERKKYEKERKKTKGKLIIESVVSGITSCIRNLIDNVDMLHVHVCTGLHAKEGEYQYTCTDMMHFTLAQLLIISL